MNDDRQSQLVRRVLLDYMTDDELASALELWQKQYQHQAIEKVSFFVFEIASTSSLRKVKKEIEQALYNGLQQIQVPEIDAQQAKAEIVKKIEQPIPIQTPVVDVQGVSFLLGQLLQALQAQDFQQVIQAIEIYIREEGISDQIGQELLRWLVERRQLNIITSDVNIVRQVVNVLYSVLCDDCGPVKADRIMAQAMAQTEQKFPLLNVRQLM